MKTGVKIIEEERKGQISKEGWTPEHDAEHKNGELADAAACYAMTKNAIDFLWTYKMTLEDDPSCPCIFPFDRKWWKPCPDDRIHELAKAGALIAAEIDRLLLEQKTER